MTDRLYYREPYCHSFEAVVTTCERRDDAFQVTLDRTAFYPTSGGQPFDLGTLATARVLDVIDREDGEIVHVVDGALAVGSDVRGEIDWTRRFDHMQQHTGQHVLSAAFDRLRQARTESFHLGNESSTIDLAPEVTASDIAAAEQEANRVVWEDRPVAIRFASAEEAAAMAFRKDPTRTGPLRVIEVEGFDLSACGGTHVARTGAIGVIAVVGAEKFRGGTRIEFLCGGRALSRFRLWRDAFSGTQRYLSVPPGELAAAVERLQSQAKMLQRTIRAQQEQLAACEARSMITRGERAGDRIVIVESLEGRDAVALKALAAATAAAEPHACIVLFSAATPALVVVACGRHAAVDASGVLQTLIAQFGGKGGGRSDLAQGGGLTGTLSEMLAGARAAIRGLPPR